MSDGARELDAALHRAGLVDTSDLGRVRARGRDTLDLLHRLTTADLRSQAPGTGASAVLTSSKGRIVARLFVHALRDGSTLLVTGRSGAPAVVAHVRRFVLREEVAVADETGDTAMFSIVGPESHRALEAVRVRPPARLGSAAAEMDGVDVLLLGHDGLSADGVSVIVPAEKKDELRSRLLRGVEEVEGSACGARALEAWRILRGLPAAGSELTEEHNPLEAGLWDAVSFTKGCYVGQEVIARLNTYDKVSRVLTGLRLPEGVAPPSPGAVVSSENRPVGAITSATVPPGWASPIALAYIRRDLPDTAPLTVGGFATPVSVTRVRLPFPEPS